MLIAFEAQLADGTRLTGTGPVVPKEGDCLTSTLTQGDYVAAGLLLR